MREFQAREMYSFALRKEENNMTDGYCPLLSELPQSCKILLTYLLVRETLLYLKKKRYCLERRFYDLRNLELLLKQQMCMEGIPY